MAETNGVGHMNGMLQAQAAMLSLTANDLRKSVRFYTEGLGFEIGDESEIDGVVRFVTVYSGPVRIGIGQDDFAKGRDRVKGTGMRLWISTGRDIHEIAERAIAAGLTLNSGPEALPWGPMAIALTDPDGFNITIANDS
jgi:catechol 2,3-dioxygenase-like lactoylglutathione lyase family enzyme